LAFISVLVILLCAFFVFLFSVHLFFISNVTKATFMYLFRHLYLYYLYFIVFKYRKPQLGDCWRMSL